MKIGVRAHDFGKKSPDELAEMLSISGYNAAQLAIPKAIAGIEKYSDIKSIHLYEIKRAFDMRFVEVSILGCYTDLSNPSLSVRDEAIKNVCLSLEHAKLIGAKAVGSETSYVRLSSEEKKECVPYMLDSITRIVHYAEEIGVDFAIEPVEWHPLDEVDVMQQILQRVNGSQRLKMIFDPANVIAPATLLDKENIWNKWIAQFSDRIIAMHIKDFVWNASGQYIPMQLGKGVMDYSEISRWIKNGHAEVALLREETIHACAKDDLNYMKTLIE